MLCLPLKSGNKPSGHLGFYRSAECCDHLPRTRPTLPASACESRPCTLSDRKTFIAATAAHKFWHSAGESVGQGHSPEDTSSRLAQWRYALQLRQLWNVASHSRWGRGLKGQLQSRLHMLLLAFIKLPCAFTPEFGHIMGSCWCPALPVESTCRM